MAKTIEYVFLLSLCLSFRVTGHASPMTGFAATQDSDGITLFWWAPLTSEPGPIHTLNLTGVYLPSGYTNNDKFDYNIHAVHSEDDDTLYVYMSVNGGILAVHIFSNLTYDQHSVMSWPEEGSIPCQPTVILDGTSEFLPFTACLNHTLRRLWFVHTSTENDHENLTTWTLDHQVRAQPVDISLKNVTPITLSPDTYSCAGYSTQICALFVSDFTMYMYLRDNERLDVRGYVSENCTNPVWVKPLTRSGEAYVYCSGAISPYYSDKIDVCDAKLVEEYPGTPIPCPLNRIAYLDSSGILISTIGSNLTSFIAVDIRPEGTKNGNCIMVEQSTYLVITLANSTILIVDIVSEEMYNLGLPCADTGRCIVPKLWGDRYVEYSNGTHLLTVDINCPCEAVQAIEGNFDIYSLYVPDPYHPPATDCLCRDMRVSPTDVDVSNSSSADVSNSSSVDVSNSSSVDVSNSSSVDVSNNSSRDDSLSDVEIGGIAGGVVSGLVLGGVLIVAIVGCIVCLRRTTKGGDVHLPTHNGDGTGSSTPVAAGVSKHSIELVNLANQVAPTGDAPDDPTRSKDLKTQGISITHNMHPEKPGNLHPAVNLPGATTLLGDGHSDPSALTGSAAGSLANDSSADKSDTDSNGSIVRSKPGQQSSADTPWPENPSHSQSPPPPQTWHGRTSPARSGGYGPTSDSSTANGYTKFQVGGENTSSYSLGGSTTHLPSLEGPSPPLTTKSSPQPKPSSIHNHLPPGELRNPLTSATQMGDQNHHCITPSPSTEQTSQDGSPRGEMVLPHPRSTLSMLSPVVPVDQSTTQTYTRPAGSDPFSGPCMESQAAEGTAERHHQAGSASSSPEEEHDRPNRSTMVASNLLLSPNDACDTLLAKQRTQSVHGKDSQDIERENCYQKVVNQSNSEKQQVQ